MEKRFFRILIVEDDEVDQIALKRFFKDKRDDFELFFANSVSEGRDKIPVLQFDVVLMDYRLRDGECFDLFDIIPIEIPIIVVTGLGNEKIAVEAMKKGAEDYIIKDPENDYLKNIPITIKKAMAQKHLKNTIRQYQFIFSSSEDLICLVDQAYRYVIVNDAYLNAYKVTREKVVGQLLSTIYSETVFKERIKPEFDEALNGRVIHFQERINFMKGEDRLMDVALYPYFERDRTISGVIINMRDITHVKRLEDELQYVKQMEALGDLAAGIAHQFNNTLSSVVGNMDLILLDHPDVAESRQFVDPIFKAVKHMTDLTKKLLAYAEGGKYQAGPLVLSKMIQALSGKLKRWAGYHISIVTLFEDEDASVLADETQMEFVLKSIVQNAVESIENEGKIIIHLKKGMISHPNRDENPLPFLIWKIIDDGKGMSETTLERIFEPFYTTKFLGRGLGMAAVHGIIKNHDGRVMVDSTVDKGSLITIHLPLLPPVI